MGSGIHGMVLLRARFGTITVVESTVSIFLDGQFGLFGLLEFRDSLTALASFARCETCDENNDE